MPFQDGNFEASECCQICQDNYPETKAWSIQSGHRSCNCIMFAEDFDASAYEEEDADSSIGYCKAKCRCLQDTVLDSSNDDS